MDASPSISAPSFAAAVVVVAFEVILLVELVILEPTAPIFFPPLLQMIFASDSVIAKFISASV